MVMDLSRIPLFAAITKRMGWLGERQAVLAQNVANADTPGYASKDVKPLDFAKLIAGTAHRLPLATTQAKHILPVSASGAFEQVTDAASERSPNGNDVSVEEQMMKISDTNNDYALTTSLYKKQIGLLQMVLGRGSSS
jgi:flagellar basal-body rod protein FlgB